MTAKPETAAEVLAEMRVPAGSASDTEAETLHRYADRLERALSAQSPSYDALLLIAQSVAGALERAGVTDCDDPGEAIDVLREQWERAPEDESAVRHRFEQWYVKNSPDLLGSPLGSRGCNLQWKAWLAATRIAGPSIPAQEDAVAFDADAVAWAYQKLLAFGCYNSEAGAMMGDRLNLMLSLPAAAIKPALSAQGEAVGWGQMEEGRIVAFSWLRNENAGCTTPLYAHPAPARVTEEMKAEIEDVRKRLISAHVSAFMDGAGTPKNADSDRKFCKTAMVDAVSLIHDLTAALEDGRHG